MTQPATSATTAFVARVYVSLKPTVNDPQGNTIAGALTSLGFGGVSGVRSGKYFQVNLNAAGRDEAATAVEQMCARLLANPVIETYRFDIEEA
jgi:phosphoribosylformylglycinamidine synthase